MKQYDIKLRVFNETPAFGKGVADLLRLIDEFGSLSAAYKTMKMSNSKAWKILKRAEADLGYPLVDRTSGGIHGGGSTLTKEGKELLSKYDKFSKMIDEYANACFKEIFIDE